MPKAAKSHVRLTRSRKKRPKATARVVSEVKKPITLDEVLIAFQKSLARSTRNAVELSRAEAGFSLGRRTLYTIDALNVSLKAHCLPASTDGQTVSRIALDFATEGPKDTEPSTIEFRVQATPIEALGRAQLLLADGDPLRERRPEYRIRGTLIGELPGGSGEPDANQEPAGTVNLGPLPHRKVSLVIIGSDSDTNDRIDIETNIVGQFELTIDAATNRVSWGGKQGRLTNVDLIESNDDFYVFAASTDPLLQSNILHFTIDRLHEQ
jgi:hypothetical protein